MAAEKEFGAVEIASKHGVDLGCIADWLHSFNRAVSRLHEGDLQLNQEVVTQIINGSASIEQLAVMFKALRELYETADAVKKEFGKLFDWFRFTYIPDSYDEIGITSSKVPGLGRLALQDDIRVSILDQQAVFMWLEENDMNDMVTETVNSSSLKSMIRRRMKAGEEVPDDLFKVTPFTRANLTKV